MKLALGESNLGMERDQLIAVRDAMGARICCVDGTLWITQERMPADFLLESGQCIVIDTQGLTLVTALQPSTLRLADGVSRLSAGWRMLSGWLRNALRPSHAH